MAKVTTAGLYFVRFLPSAMVAALPTRPAASTQNVSVLDAQFGDSHVHSRAVVAVDDRVVDVCTKASSSRNIRNFISQRIVPRGEGVPARARRGVFAFLIQSGSAVSSVALPVFASVSGVAHGPA